MAKSSKHSPALFEVVHGKRPFDKTARDTVLRTPSWWFKGRKRMAETGALAPSGGATAVEEPPPFDDIPPSVADPTENPSILQNRHRFADGEAAGGDSGDAAPVDTLAIPAALVAASRTRRRSPLQFTVDRERHELFVRVRYTTAVVAGVTVAMLLALAYIAGRHAGRGSAAMASLTSEEIAAGPVDRGVLDLPSRGGGSSPAANNPPAPAFTSSTGGNAGNAGNAVRPPAARGTPVTTAPLAGTDRAGAGPSQPTIPPTAAPNPEANGKRIVGRQYVLVQSYPPEQKKTAEEARDLLAQAGVVCTVEKAPAGWPPTWSSVVGATGFDRASGPAYQNYLAAIERVNEKFAGKASFKRFDPVPIRWKERAD